MLYNFWSQISAFYSFHYNFCSFFFLFRRSTALAVVLLGPIRRRVVMQLEYRRNKKLLKSWLPSSNFNCVAAVTIAAESDVDVDNVDGTQAATRSACNTQLQCMQRTVALFSNA